jgi:hypothetical protein
MIDRILSVGCSFSALRPSNDIKTCIGNEFAKNYDIPADILAWAGNGNRRINIDTQLYFETRPDQKQNTLAVIQWSTPVRRDFPAIKYGYSNDLKPIYWKSWKSHKQREAQYIKDRAWDLDMDQPLVELENLISLQNYFKLNKIAYVMYFGLDPEIHVDLPQIKILLNQVDKKRIFNYNTHHMEWCIENNYTCTDQDPHPNEDGIRIWCESMFNWIEENKFFDTIS